MIYIEGSICILLCFKFIVDFEIKFSIFLFLSIGKSYHKHHYHTLRSLMYERLCLHLIVHTSKMFFRCILCYWKITTIFGNRIEIGKFICSAFLNFPIPFLSLKKYELFHQWIFIESTLIYFWMSQCKYVTFFLCMFLL